MGLEFEMTGFGAVLLLTFASTRFFASDKNLSPSTAKQLFFNQYKSILFFEGDKLLGVEPTETCENIYP